MFRALILLFIIKTRFPKDRNVYDIIKKRYGPDTLKLLRTVKTTNKKSEKLKLELQFLRKCKAYEVIPKFIKFKLFTKRLYNSNLYKGFQFKLLLNEINFKKKISTKQITSLIKLR